MFCDNVFFDAGRFLCRATAFFYCFQGTEDCGEVNCSFKRNLEHNLSFVMAPQLVGFSSRICCSSDMFLRSGGYWEDMEALGFEDVEEAM